MRFLKEQKLKQIYMGDKTNYSKFHDIAKEESLDKSTVDSQFDDYIATKIRNTANRYTNKNFVYKNKPVEDIVKGIQKKRSLHETEEEQLKVRYDAKDKINQFFFSLINTLVWITKYSVFEHKCSS